MTRRLVPASLTGRLIVTVVAFVAVVGVLVAVSATLIMRSYLTSQLDQDLDQTLNRTRAALITGYGPGGGFDGAPPGARGNRVGTLSVLVDGDTAYARPLDTQDGRQRAPSQASLDRLTSLETSRKPQTVDLAELGEYRVASVALQGGEVLYQGLPAGQVQDTIRTLLLLETLLVLAGVGATAVAGRALIRHQLTPLREVAATAHEVAQMPLSKGAVGETVRVPEDLTDPTTEVGQVGEALNQLLAHVEQSLDARHESEQQARQFLADASHELRTPLSTIKGYAELSRRMKDPAQLEEVLSKVEDEGERMARLVEDMLLLARLDAGREIQPTEVDLTRLVAEAVHDQTVVAADHTWRVELPAEPVTLEGDEQRLHQLVTNLLRNAARHTPAGTTVETSLVVDDGTITLSVADDGPGVDPELLPNIFDRFARGDSSRTRASGGSGLGTSLVRAIAHAHGGTASVASVPGDTRFTVTLPR